MGRPAGGQLAEVELQAIEISAVFGDVGILAVNPMFDTGGEVQRKTCTIVLQRSVAPDIADAPRKPERITTHHGVLEIVGIQIDPSAYTLTCAEIGGKK